MAAQLRLSQIRMSVEGCRLCQTKWSFVKISIFTKFTNFGQVYSCWQSHQTPTICSDRTRKIGLSGIAMMILPDKLPSQLSSGPFLLNPGLQMQAYDPWVLLQTVLSTTWQLFSLELSHSIISDLTRQIWHQKANSMCSVSLTFANDITHQIIRISSDSLTDPDVLPWHLPLLHWGRWMFDRGCVVWHHFERGSPSQHGQAASVTGALLGSQDDQGPNLNTHRTRSLQKVSKLSVGACSAEMMLVGFVHR